jgi:hypothetical protein
MIKYVYWLWRSGYEQGVCLMSLFGKCVASLAGRSTRRKPEDQIDGLRRALVISAGTMAASLGKASPAIVSADSAGIQSVDQSCRISGDRLDALVAKAYPLFNAPAILPSFDTKRYGASFDVDLHRIATHTVVPETGEKLRISGLLALPVGVKGELPLLSWQHGTILSFDQVPSNLTRLADPSCEPTDAADSLETLFNVHRFVGQGYAMVAADYIGKGPFHGGQSEGYAVRDASVRTCLDVLAAGQTVMRKMGFRSSELFLHGWSQGALNTQWLHQALRKQSRPITATAVASPFNDLNEAWRFWGGAQTFPLPEGVTTYPSLPNWISLCMIIALGSYEFYYGLTGLMKNAIRPEYQDFALNFWRSYKLSSEQTGSCPSGSELLVPGFFEHFTAPQNSAFLRHLAANRATYWAYDSPIRFDYGLADEVLHPDMVFPALSAGGALATGVPITGGSHRGTFLAGLYGDTSTPGVPGNILSWFNGLR